MSILKKHPETDIYQHEWEAYLDAQNSGEYNMLTDANEVMEYYGIKKDTYFTIIRNWDSLLKYFGG